MNFQPNPGKKLIVEVESQKWARYPVKIHFVTTDDTLENILTLYVLSYSQKEDIVVLGQKIVSILQKRVVYKKDIKVGRWAKFLSGFAQKTPYGFGIGNPLKMQLALQIAGLPRILFSALISGALKIFGIKGVFYHLAGNQISRIDGFYGESFSQYAEMGILAPENCDKLCQALKEKHGLSFLVGDVNDFDPVILGKSSDLIGKEKMSIQLVKDNPAGQSNYQTPILIARKVKETQC